jgi:protein-S-isoprenylcysteine O-methyltransferase Ste14
MADIGTVLGWTSFLILALWRLYWFVSGQKAEKEKPKTREQGPPFHRKQISKYVTMAAFGVVGVQLLGIPLFPMPQKSLPFQLIGFLLVVVGMGIAVIGRYNLSTNWANCYEYQVKRKQELVTNGLYAFIRHPLYCGIALFFIGSELITQSYLVFVYCFAFLAADQQATYEEALLIKHFGDQYKTYMKRTKRFIPFVY